MPCVRSTKIKERVELADRINDIGSEMSPCTNCEKRGRKCVAATMESRRCSECVRRGLKCDVDGPSAGDWAAIRREEDRLATELKETLSKQLRIMKQQELLRSRASDMLRRGLKTLDELDEAEDREQKEAEERAAAEHHATAAAVTSNRFSPSLVAYADGDPLAASFDWDAWLAACGNPEGAPSSSQGI